MESNMPLATTETGLFSQAVATAATEQGELAWFAAYTCANQEKRVVPHFEARAVEHFLPLYSSVRRWKDRNVQLELPLFPGYVFVRIALGLRLRVVEVPGVVCLVGFNGKPYPLPDSEIESLRKAIGNASRIEPHPYTNLSVGSRVRIKSGPLAGVEGKLVRKKNVCRVVLSLDLIARSAAVEIDFTDIERVN
jgi:transcription antitermination factor NusG